MAQGDGRRKVGKVPPRVRLVQLVLAVVKKAVWIDVRSSVVALARLQLVGPK